MFEYLSFLFLFSYLGRIPDFASSDAYDEANYVGFDTTHSNEGTSGAHFRNEIKGGKKRGSVKPPQEKVTVFPHKMDSSEPKVR